MLSPLSAAARGNKRVPRHAHCNVLKTPTSSDLRRTRPYVVVKQLAKMWRGPWSSKRNGGTWRGKCPIETLSTYACHKRWWCRCLASGFGILRAASPNFKVSGLVTLVDCYSESMQVMAVNFPWPVVRSLETMQWRQYRRSLALSESRHDFSRGRIRFPQPRKQFCHC